MTSSSGCGFHGVDTGSEAAEAVNPEKTKKGYCIFVQKGTTGRSHLSYFLLEYHNGISASEDDCQLLKWPTRGTLWFDMSQNDNFCHLFHNDTCFM